MMGLMLAILGFYLFGQLSADLSYTQDVPRNKFTAIVYSTDKWRSAIKKIAVWIILLLYFLETII